MKTVKSMNNDAAREFIMFGRKLLFARVIGPRCYRCGRAASDVVLVRNIGPSTRLEVLPACEACKVEDLEDCGNTWLDGGTA